MNVFYLIIISFKTLKADSYYMSVQDIDINEVSEPFNFMGIVVYIVLGLSLFLNIILLLSNKKKNKRRNSSTNNKSGGEFESYYNKLDKVNNQLKNKIVDLEKQLVSIQNRSYSSHKKVDDTIMVENEYKTQSSRIKEDYSDENPTTVELEIPKTTIFYLPSPFEDNRFSIEDVSTEQTPSSLYQIILDSSNTTGKLLIIENADFTRALNSPDHYLEKACIYENAFSPNANGINIVEPGKVKLENQDWLITQKIKIKFI